MSRVQILTLILLACLIALFLWDRLRYDLVALLVLIGALIPIGEAVLVMGPIAASLAQQLGYRIDPFLMVVAFGAGSDFLSPIGHQSNTLVMGLGGYRFGDYWKLGLPLSVMVVVLGVPLIMLLWPLH